MKGFHSPRRCAVILLGLLAGAWARGADSATAAGFTPADWRLMTVDNPAAAYAIRGRVPEAASP